eukprot:CAMPEP_0116904388 /NCGR_PEP_ID=MMETSP0467-20121206/11397_1 /TAXON_ID=283647 /ORGANISM="Mesodinium pulex, Strain SPMC105" /LENGTH=53 /DNA_ID=CAMNT_0004579039 /DNA_START=316 /DNA_END=477 /DNA_ORIENTATION=+
MIFNGFGKEQTQELHMVFSITSAMTTVNDALVTGLEVKEIKLHLFKLKRLVDD